MPASQPFSVLLKQWLGKRYHKEGADALGVKLQTFRNWIYGISEPLDDPQSRQAIEQKMKDNPDK
jgi:hypothetical protein